MSYSSLHLNKEQRRLKQPAVWFPAKCAWKCRAPCNSTTRSQSASRVLCHTMWKYNMTVIIFCIPPQGDRIITKLFWGKRRSSKPNTERPRDFLRKYCCGEEISHHQVFLICLIFSPNTCNYIHRCVCVYVCVRAAASAPLCYCCKSKVGSSVIICYTHRHSHTHRDKNWTTTPTRILMQTAWSTKTNGTLFTFLWCCIVQKLIYLSPTSVSIFGITACSVPSPFQPFPNYGN